MRYYIEAYADYGQVLGNLDGQAALGDVRQPTRCKAWQDIVSGKVRCLPTIKLWYLVNEYGNIEASHTIRSKS